MIDNNLTGIELIAAERTEQMGKHGYTLDHDQNHDNGELVSFATAILFDNAMHYPSNWNKKHLYKILLKDRVRQLAIAGALIAAEIDRIKHSANLRTE